MTPSAGLTLISFSRISVSFVLYASQMPMSFATIVLKRRMLPSTFESNDDGGGGGSGSSGSVGCGSVAEPDARLLACLDLQLLDDVLLGAGVQHDAPVELEDLAVLDRDVVVAVVTDARGDALAVDRVAVEVDRDAGGADDEAVPETVCEVVSDLDARPDHLAAEDEAGHRRRADVHVNFAGVGSALPVMSVAWTWNLRAPSGSRCTTSATCTAPTRRSAREIQLALERRVRVLARELEGRVGQHRDRVRAGVDRASPEATRRSAARRSSTCARPGSGRRCPSGRSRATSNVCTPGMRSEYVRLRRARPEVADGLRRRAGTRS